MTEEQDAFQGLGSYDGGAVEDPTSLRTDREDLEFKDAVATLCYVRMIRQEIPFILLYNLKRFRFSQDILIYNNCTIYCIEIVHGRSEMIPRRELTETGGAFSLSKHYDSYCKIKRAIENNAPPFNIKPLKEIHFKNLQFIIYTNLDIEHSPHDLPCNSFSSVESSLRFGADDDDIFSFRDKDKDIWTPTRSSMFHEFLGNVRIFSRQSDTSGLKQLLKLEVEMTAGGLDTDFLTYHLESSFRDWFYKDNWYLSETSSLWYKCLQYILNAPLKTKLRQIKFKFDCNKVDLPLPSTGFMNIVVPEVDRNYRLLKIYALVENRSVLLLNLSAFTKKFSQVDSLCRSQVCCLLVVDVDDASDLEKILTWNNVHTCGVILVTSDPLYELSNIPSYIDHWRFDQFTEVSQSKFGKRIVELQGKELELWKLVDKDSLRYGLGNQTISLLISKLDISIGKPMEPPVCQNYTFVHQVLIKESVLYDAHPVDIFAVSNFPHNRKVSNTTVVLIHSDYESYKELCRKWRGVRNIHWVEFAGKCLIWKHTTGSDNTIKRYVLSPSNQCRAEVRGCFHKENIPDDWKDKLRLINSPRLDIIAAAHKKRYPNHWVIFVPKEAACQFMDKLCKCKSKPSVFFRSFMLIDDLLLFTGVDLKMEHALDDWLLQTLLYSIGNISVFVDIPDDFPKDRANYWREAARDFLVNTQLSQFSITQLMGPHHLSLLNFTEDYINRLYKECQNTGRFVLEEPFVTILLNTRLPVISAKSPVDADLTHCELYRTLHLATEQDALRLGKILPELTEKSNYHLKFNPPLNEAARCGNCFAISELLKLGSNINATDIVGWTPLHLASEHADVNIVRVLLENGADLKATSLTGHTSLHLACERGNTDTVHLLLDKGADVDSKDHSGCSPLHLAAKEGHAAVVAILLEHRVQVQNADIKGRTPFHLAAENGQTDVLHLLLNESLVNYVCHDNSTPLHGAAKGGHLQAVELLCKSRAVIEARCNSRTPLFEAAEHGHVDIVRMLLSQSADVNAKDIEGRTPLFHAARQGHYDVVEALVKTGSDVDSTDQFGCTALHTASEKVLKLLIHSGANVEARSKCGRTPFLSAAWQGTINVLRALIELGVNKDVRDCIGRNALYASAWQGHTEAVRLLLDCGLKVEIGDDCGRTALEAAAWHGHNDVIYLLFQVRDLVSCIDDYGFTALYASASAGHLHTVRFLVSQGADINACDNFGNSPLHGAAMEGFTNVAEYLVRAGVDVNAKSRVGRTPLHVAAGRGHEEVVKLLIYNQAVIDSGDIYSGPTPVDLAAERGYMTVVRLLEETEY